MSLKRVLYRNIQHGYNDTAAPSELKDSECRALINVDIGERGGAQTRKGIEKVNSTSAGAEIEQSFEWIVNGKSRMIAVHSNKLWSVEQDGTLKEKISLASNTIGWVTIQNRLYFGDGSELYVWGEYDFDTSKGTQTVEEGKIVLNKPVSTGGGTVGKFYKAKKKIENIDLAKENYSDTVKWEDVTDIDGIISSVVRPIAPKKGGTKHVVKLTIDHNSVSDASVSVTLNGVNTSTTLVYGDTATSAATKIRSTTYTGWKTGGSGNIVTFTADTEGDKGDAFYDASTTQAYGSIVVETKGKVNDNNIEAVRKCKEFIQHPLSLRIFAIGNPDTPTAVYYSGFNDFTYWPKEAMVVPTTPEKRAMCMLHLSDHILVGYDQSWWRWSGIDPAKDAQWKQLPIPYGVLSNKAAVLTPFSFTFASQTDIYTVSAAILSQEIVMLQSDQMIKPLGAGRIEKTIKSIANANNVRAVFYDNKFMLAYSETLGRNDSVLVFDQAANGFVKYEGWHVNEWTPTANGSLFFASKNYVFKSGMGLHDIDVETGKPTPIRTYVETKDYDGGNGMDTKYITHLYMLFKQFEHLQSEVKISLIGDYARVEYDKVDLAEAFIWGRSWGGVWGWSDLMELASQPRISARSFRVIIENERMDDPIGFYGVGFEYKPMRPRPRMITGGKELIVK